MPDLKISELTTIPNEEITSLDMIPIVDQNIMVTKKITIQQLDQRYGGSFVTANIVGSNVGISGGNGKVIGPGNVTISIPQPIGPSDSPIFNVVTANQLNVDSIRLDNNTISTNIINQDLQINPNGNGSVLIQKLLRLNSSLSSDIEINNQSGSDVNLTTPTKTIAHLTNAGLSSIESLSSAVSGKIQIITNKTGNPVTVKDGSGINTGTGLDITLEADASLWLYCSSDSNWYIIGGSGGGGASALEDLTDVDINTPIDGQVLTRQGLEWINATPTPAPVSSVNGKVDVVVLDLDDINDVTITTPIDSQVLSYQSGQWVNQTLPSAPVTSVNGQTDVVVLDADDIEYTSGFSVADELGSLGVRVGTAESDIDALELQALDFVKGPGFAAATDGNLAAFDMTSGRLIKEVPVNATNDGNVTTPGNLDVRSIDTQESTILGDSKSFFKTLGLWTKYKNVVPGPTPEPDPLGTPDADFTFTHDDSNTNPYGRIGSLRIGKPSLSGDVQGNGGFLNQFIQKAMRGAWAEFSYSHINLGGYIPNSLKVFVYDVTNSAWLNIVGDANVPANEGIHRIKFYIPSNTTDLRIFTHMTSTEASTLMAKLIVGYDIKPVEPLQSEAGSVPTGTISAFAGNIAPEGYAMCDGSTLDRVANANLFAVIGTNFGEGDGVNTFHLPDFRGMFLRGRADGSANDPDRLSRTAMNVGGAIADNVGSVQGHAFQTHTHIQNAHNHTNGLGNPGGTNTTAYLYGSSINSTAHLRAMGAIGANATQTRNALSSSITATNQNASASGLTAQATASETRPINAYVNYIIKL